MSKSEIAKRYLLFIISLFFSALGVAFTKHGELGVSPISSVVNVMITLFTEQCRRLRNPSHSIL